MEVDALLEIIEDSTKVYRKGPLVDVKRSGVANVVEYHGYPSTDDAKITDSDNSEKVDMIFVDVVVDKAKAQAHRKALEEALEGYPQPERLAGGPSYMELAGTMGIGQERALRLMALGSTLGMWKLIDAKRTIGSDDETAKQMAGQGFLMISGWKAQAGQKAREKA